MQEWHRIELGLLVGMTWEAIFPHHAYVLIIQGSLHRHLTAAGETGERPIIRALYLKSPASKGTGRIGGRPRVEDNAPIKTLRRLRKQGGQIAAEAKADSCQTGQGNGPLDLVVSVGTDCDSIEKAKLK